MDSFKLPIVSPKATLSTALNLMKEKQRSALVVKDRNRFWVATAGDIHASGFGRNATLAKLPFKRQAYQPMAVEIGRGKTFTKAAVTRPQQYLEAWDRGIRESGFAIGIASVTRQSATVVTMSELVRGAWSGAPADCSCTGPQQHPYGSDKDGKSCGFCGFPIACN